MTQTRNPFPDATLRNAATAALVALVVLAAGCLGAVADPGKGKAWEAWRNDPICYGTLDGVDLRTASIADIQAMLSKPGSDVTSVDLVEYYLERISVLDQRLPEAVRLNGVRHVNPNALAEAAALDAERAAGHVRGPMHGIPIMVKDNIGTHDMPTTAGSIALENNFPIKDAGLIARLRENGAIILGKLNLLEWANWGAPSNGSSMGGPQHNAYNGRGAGSSSSGPGVAGSMAYGAVALGSETSGSILGPTGTNSLAGLKTSHGLVSGAGVIPIAHYYDVVGPMGRNVYDLAVTLDAMAGTDPDDRHSAEADANIPPGGYANMLSTTALEGVRLGYENNSNPLFQQALRELEALGAVLVPMTPKAAHNAAGFMEWTSLPNEFHHEINAYLQTEADPTLPFKTWHELMAWMRENHPETHNVGVDGVGRVPLGASGLALASAATPGNALLTEVHAPAMIAASRAVADAIFVEHDIDATVSFGSAFTILGASAGYPTVLIPLGYEGDTPRGIAWFGPRFSDGQLLAYAYAFEQVRERRIIPEDFNPAILEGLCEDRPGPPLGVRAGGLAGLPGRGDGQAGPDPVTRANLEVDAVGLGRQLGLLG